MIANRLLLGLLVVLCTAGFSATAEPAPGSETQTDAIALLCSPSEEAASLPYDAGTPQPLFLSTCGQEPTANDPRCDVCNQQCQDWYDWCVCLCAGEGPGCRSQCLTGVTDCTTLCNDNCS